MTFNRAPFLLLFLCLSILSGCSGLQNSEKDFSARNKKAARITAYGLIGLPRDLLDLPFSCVVAMDQNIYHGEKSDMDVPMLIGSLSGYANWISHGTAHSWEYLAGNEYVFSGCVAGFSAYLGWLYLGHPAEVLLCRYPYDDRWWMLGDPDPEKRKWWTPGSRLKDNKEILSIFFPNFKGMLGEKNSEGKK